MARSRALKFTAALGAALLLVTGGATAAFADQIVVDGDGLAPIHGPVGQGAVVQACTDQAVEFTVLIAARRQGGTNVSFANLSKVFMSVDEDSTTHGMDAQFAEPYLELPEKWLDQNANTFNPDPVAATVTLPAQAVDGTGTLVLSFTGTRASNGSALTGQSNVSVEWTTQQCGTADVAPPVLTLPDDMVVEATSAAGKAVNFEATATDETDPAIVPVTCAPASGSVFPLGVTQVLCSATDAAGNTTPGSFTVTVEDTTAPALSAMADIELEATAALTPVTWTNPTATDAVDPDPVVECLPAPGSTFGVGTHTVECTATDASGNVGSSSFQVTVADTTAPVLTLPANITAEATSADGAAVEFTTSALDAVDGAVDVTCVPASGSVFPLGETTVTCSAEDAAGNPAEGSFTVTVQDTTAPTLSAMADVELEATDPTTPVSWIDPTATDAVDPNPVVACSPAAGSTFGVGTHAVTCTATDASGNVGSTSFQVTVKDTTPPVITWVGGPEDGASYVFGSVPAEGSCTAYDLVDGDVECTVTGHATTVGTHTLTAIAEDSRHNKAEEKRSYTVEAWTLHGFFKPVDMNGVWNSVKGGSTVPLKFEVFAGDTELTDVDAIGARFQVLEIKCGTDIVADDIEMTSTGKTVLRFDESAGQFIQNWQTPKKANTCYKVMLTTADGTGIVANFKLK